MMKIYDKGKRLNKQPGQKEAEFDKKKILVVPTAFYVLLYLTLETNDNEKWVGDNIQGHINGRLVNENDYYTTEER